MLHNMLHAVFFALLSSGSLHRQLSAVSDGDNLASLAALRANRLHFEHDVHALDDATEHDVAAIQPARLDCGRSQGAALSIYCALEAHRW